MIRAGVRSVTVLGREMLHCDSCGCNGVSADHVPGDLMCRLLATERYEKNRADQ